MPTIHIHSEEELLQKFADLAHTVHNMRHAQKYWHIHFGGEAKAKKEYWEKKLDAQLNQLGLSEHQNLSSIKVVKE